MRGGALGLTIFLVAVGVKSADGESIVVPTVLFVAAGVFLLIAIWGDPEETERP